MRWQNPSISVLSRTPRRHLLALFFLLAMAGGCWAAPAAAANRFEQLRDQDLRVASVSYKLSVANGFRCRATPSPQLGFILHGIAQYGMADRAEAADRFDLGAQVGVMAVVAGSPAEKAGLMAKDRLISVNGHALPVADVSDLPPSRATVAQAQQILVGEMSKGAVTLHVSRSGVDRELSWVGEFGCPANVELVPGTAANAWADGEGVVVGAGILTHCRNDDDLALVIAHEMAHNLLHHHQRLVSARIHSRTFVPSDDGNAVIRETEEEADRLAVGLAMEAGYDLSDAGRFLSGMMEQIGPMTMAMTHPGLDRRLRLLNAAIAISLLQQRNGG